MNYFNFVKKLVYSSSYKSSSFCVILKVSHTLVCYLVQCSEHLLDQSLAVQRYQVKHELTQLCQNISTL